MTKDEFTNSALNNFLKENAGWEHRGSSDEYVDLENYLYKSSAKYTDLCVQISMSINLSSNDIFYEFNMFDDEDAGMCMAPMNSELINDVEQFINFSQKMLASHLPGYTFNDFTIFNRILDIELEPLEFIKYIEKRINDTNENPLVALIKDLNLDRRSERRNKYIIALLENGADPHIENTNGESALSILNSRNDNSDFFESLKQKWMLEDMVDQQNSSYLSL